ncbi:MAG: ArnT family glycosyltransferase [Parvularculaceae bacterium]
MVRILAELWKRPLQRFAALAAALTAARIMVLIFSDTNLGADEAQYWFWSQTPAFGYFSKPPLIAWAIGFTTALFGDSEWAIRLSAPVFHFGSAIFLYAAARRLYDERTGFWTGAGWLTLPGVTFSGTLITTDAPLLFFWSTAVYSFFRLLNDERAPERRRVWAIILGAAVGLGFLSKYAMIYFLFGAVLALLFSPAARRRLRAVDAAIAAITCALILAPNFFWNMAHNFQTLSHTAANAHWNGRLFHPEELWDFLTAQFGVFGPLPMLALIWGATRLARSARMAGAMRETDLALIAFILPPLVIVGVQAFVSRAHANWAATAYPTAMIFVTAWALRMRFGALVKASAAIHLVAAAVFSAGFVNFAVADALGLSNAVKRVRGWETLGAETREAAKGADYDAILSDDREIMGELLYYVGEDALPIVAWNANATIDSHYEAFKAFDPERHVRVLYVTEYADALLLADQFATVKPVGQARADLKRGKARTFYFFDTSDYAPH